MGSRIAAQAREGHVRVRGPNAAVVRWTCRVFFVAMLCGLMVSAAAPVARAENNNCGEPPDPSRYVAQPGDTEDAQHIAVERSFTGQGRLELNVCSGELHIKPGHGDRLTLRIEIASNPELKMRAYVKTLDISGDHATISLQFPHKVHPVVVLELPSTTSLTSQVNLGAGKFYFDAEGIKGNREVNLGAGEAHLTMADDRGYANFEANVGMGSFHDHRPGGRSSHFIISREYQGKGHGSLQVNVGAGSIDIDPTRGGTI
jgi:hypothetical protein